MAKRVYLLGFVIGFVVMAVTACRDNESDYSPTNCITIVESGVPAPTPDPCP